MIYTRHIATKVNYLHPYYTTGFADAESCFHVVVAKGLKYRTGWEVQAKFEIHLHKKDLALLEWIQVSWGGIGKIYSHGDYILYRIRTIEDLKVLTGHFDKYPLISQKQADFLLFKRVVEILKDKSYLTVDGLTKIVSIKAAMNNGLSDTLRESFPDITPVERPVVHLSTIPDPHWLAGFAEGDGCVYVVIQKSSSYKIKYRTSLKFQITQHSRDAELLKSIIGYLGCGRHVPCLDHGNFIVERFSDIHYKIIPFFDKYPFKGAKAKEFADFKKVAVLINSKEHLTEKGLETIKLIKAGMNRGRSS